MKRADVAIETLRLRLPSGFESRAAGLGRGVAERLSRLGVAAGTDLSRVSVPVVRAHPGESDAVIAERIAQSIHGQLNPGPPTTRT